MAYAVAKRAEKTVMTFIFAEESDGLFCEMLMLEGSDFRMNTLPMMMKILEQMSSTYNVSLPSDDSVHRCTCPSSCDS